MSQHLGELHDGILRPFRVNICQGVDIVKRIEQKVRTYLVTQAAQLRVALCRLRLLTFLFQADDMLTLAYGIGYKDSEEEIDAVTQ